MLLVLGPRLLSIDVLRLLQRSQKTIRRQLNDYLDDEICLWENNCAKLHRIFESIADPSCETLETVTAIAFLEIILSQTPSIDLAFTIDRDGYFLEILEISNKWQPVCHLVASVGITTDYHPGLYHLVRSTIMK